VEILTRQPPDIDIAALTGLDEITALVGLFETIAEREGWQPDDQLRDCVQAAVYFAVLVSATLVGGVQLVRTSAAGSLPCQRVWPELAPQIRASDAHVVVMALQKAARGKEGLLWLLTAEVWKYCLRHGIERVWIEATPATFRVYERLGWPLRAQGPTRTHWGEPCIPALVTMGDVAASIARRAERSPRLCSLVLQTLQGLGTGADPGYQVAPPIDVAVATLENESSLCS
jgi:hypothetical protein